jgi:hypothetical protein
MSDSQIEICGGEPREGRTVGLVRSIKSVSKGDNVTKSGHTQKMSVISCHCHISIMNEMSETKL